MSYTPKQPSIWGALERNGYNNLTWGVDAWGAGISPPVTFSAQNFSRPIYTPGFGQQNGKGVATKIATIWGAGHVNGFNNFTWGVTAWGGNSGTVYTPQLQVGGP